MPEDIEVRLRGVERLIERVIAKVEAMEHSLDSYWDKIDARQISETTKDSQVAVMLAEHAACKRKHDEEDKWKSSRVGALVDKLLPFIIGAAIMYYLRGGLK